MALFSLFPTIVENTPIDYSNKDMNFIFKSLLSNILLIAYTAKIADMAKTRAVPSAKWKIWYQQSLMGPYEALQTRLNVKIIFVLSAAPFHVSYIINV